MLRKILTHPNIHANIAGGEPLTSLNSPSDDNGSSPSPAKKIKKEILSEYETMLPLSTLESQLLPHLTQMGFTKLETLKTLRSISLVNMNYNEIIESCMIGIVTEREEKEETRKQDEARLLSEEDYVNTKVLSTSDTWFEKERGWKRVAVLEKNCKKWYPKCSLKWLEGVIERVEGGEFESEDCVVKIFEEVRRYDESTL